MKASEIMTREVHSVRPETPVGEVARLMITHGVSGVPVTDEAGQLLGMVTEGDLLVRHARLHFPRYLKFLDSIVVLGDSGHLERELTKVLATTAGELMTRQAFAASPDLEVGELLHEMADRGIGTVPVVEQGRVVGVVSRADLLRLLVSRETSA